MHVYSTAAGGVQEVLCSTPLWYTKQIDEDVCSSQIINKLDFDTKNGEFSWNGGRIFRTGKILNFGHKVGMGEVIKY